MTENKFYRFTPDGYYEGEVGAAIDPLETKKAGHPVYIHPCSATDVAPETKNGYWPRWQDGAWTYVLMPKTVDDLVAFGRIKHDQTTGFWRQMDAIRNELVPKAERYKTELNDGYWTVEEIPEPTEEEKAAQLLAEAKGDRAAAVSRIIVSVERKDKDGKTVKVLNFDGDEEAQTRMSRTIVAAQALGADIETETRTWVMSDNSIEQVTIAELAEALRLAGDAQTALWTVPYEE